MTITEWFRRTFRSELPERPPEADLGVPVTRGEREAEWRFHRLNSLTRLRGCPCGAAATVSQAASADYLGTVPPLWWTCADHAGAAAFTSFRSAGQLFVEPLYEHDQPCPLGDTVGAMRPEEGPARWSCSHRSHEPWGF